MSLPSVNYNVIQTGTIALNNIQSAFQFYNTSGESEWNITGLPKGQTQFTNTNGLNQNDNTSHNFIRQLAQKAFGSMDADDFFDNSVALSDNWEIQITNILTSLNGTTANGNASKELIDKMISDQSERFYVTYNASVSGATAGTYTGLTATGSSSSATCTVSTVINSSTEIQSINVSATNGTFNVNENVTITNGGGSGVNISISNINSVQTALLNGTLNSSLTPTNAPLEVGDKIKLHYTINCHDDQVSASGNDVSMSQTFFVEYTIV